MMRVMMVDDESIVCEYMRKMIDWNALGYEVVSEVRDGQDAIEQYKMLKPDLVLLDINIPFVNGLDVARFIKGINPEQPIVIITGYSQFEYAQKAITIGIQDYLLKPFSADELIVALVKSNEVISSQKNNTKRSSLLYRNLLKQLISDEKEFDHDFLFLELRSNGFNLDAPYYIVLCLEVDNLFEGLVNRVQTDTRKKKVLKFFKNWFSQDCGENMFITDTGHIVGIFHMSELENRNDLINTGNRFCEHLSLTSHFTVTIGCGSAQDHWSGLTNSYKDAQRALQNKFLVGKGKVIDCINTHKEFSEQSVVSSISNETLLMALRTKNWDELQQTIQEIAERLNQHSVPVEYARSVCESMATLCFSYIMETGRSVHEIYGETFHPYEEARAIDTIDEMLVWLKNLFHCVVSNDLKDTPIRIRNMLKKAQVFIDENYMRSDFTVEEIAGHLYISATFLRLLFKDEIGVNVIQYLKRIRMSKAKQLLETGLYKNYEVAEMTGFSDPGYFSKAFKKHYGVSPKGFENEMYDE